MKAQQTLKKTAPPRPSSCENCGHTTDRLQLDHDHTTGEFRGWLCKSCDVGIGNLGDNIAGLAQAIIYLTEHTS